MTPLLDIKFWKTATCESIKQYIEQGADVNAQNDRGVTPLMMAVCFNKDHKVMEPLIKHGADVNAQDEEGQTALIYAAAHNPDPKAITTLMAHGADITLRTTWGYTALMRAISNSNNKVLGVLLQQEANMHAKPHKGPNYVK